MRALHCVQFVDDVLDFTGSTMQLGKPTLNDLRSGLATAPVLYAAEEHPELNTLILRRFKSEGEQFCIASVCPSRPSAPLLFCSSPLQLPLTDQPGASGAALGKDAFT